MVMPKNAVSDIVISGMHVGLLIFRIVEDYLSEDGKRVLVLEKFVGIKSWGKLKFKVSADVREFELERLEDTSYRFLTISERYMGEEQELVET